MGQVGACDDIAGRKNEGSDDDEGGATKHWAWMVDPLTIYDAAPVPADRGLKDLDRPFLPNPESNDLLCGITPVEMTHGVGELHLLYLIVDRVAGTVMMGDDGDLIRAMRPD